MSGPYDDWDEPKLGCDGPGELPGYRAGGEGWSPSTAGPVVPASMRILVLADLKVRQFCERPGIELDLPGAVAACLHLVRQSGFLAATSMTMSREADGLGPAYGSGGPDLREDFGPHVENVMDHHADWLLDAWYRASADKRRPRPDR